MITGTSLYSFNSMIRGGMTPCEIISALEKSDCQCVEVLDMYMKTDVEKAQVRSRLQSSPLKVCAYGIDNNFVVEQDRWHQQIDYVIASIDIAKSFGTNLLRVFAAYPNESFTYEQGMEKIIEAFLRLSPYAEEKGVILALENHGRFAGRAAQVQSIIDSVASPNLKSTFDTGNFLLVGDNPLEAAQRLSGHIAHVHFKDFAKDENGPYKADNETIYSGCAPGMGDVPILEIVACLKQNGYEGALALEFEGPKDLFSIFKSLSYMKGLV